MDYIYEIEHNLPREVCEKIIDKFEADDRKTAGITWDQVIDPTRPNDFKKSTDLQITHMEGWSEIDCILKDKLTEGLKEYEQHIKAAYEYDSIPFRSTVGGVFANMIDRGYQIQRTKKNEFYTWHHDDVNRSGRVITFIWYLNTLDPKIDGGTTDFECGKSIVPKQGKLIFFPATWTYIHRGKPVLSDNTKYICTGWVIQNDPPNQTNN